MSLARSLVVCIGLGLLVGSASWGQEPPGQDRGDGTGTPPLSGDDLQARVAERVEAYVKARPHVRLVVGFWREGKRQVWGFGPDRPQAADTPDGRIVYEIGSVTKVFTGILLARAEREGRLRLDTPIGDLLPPDLEAPEALRAITLVQLATHTSGLPRMPGNHLKTAIWNLSDPYKNYREADLLAYLRTAEPKTPAARKSSYSNLGGGLLGYLLAREAGRSYETLLREAILDPLGMPDTSVALPDSRRDRLIGGHYPDGRPVPNWDFDVLAPAGGLRSTADDLLSFLGANLQPRDDTLGLALQRAQEVHFEGERGMKVGLAWQIRDLGPSGPRLHWHNGGTGGYESYLGLVASRKVGVVLLSNTGDSTVRDSSLDRIGFDLIRLAAGVPPDPAKK